MLNKTLFLLAIAFGLWCLAEARPKPDSSLNDFDDLPTLNSENKEKLLKCITGNKAAKELTESTKKNGSNPLESLEKTIQCMEEIPELRPVILMVNSLQPFLRFFKSKKQEKDLCGIPTNSNDPKLKELVEKFESLAETDKLKNMDFCDFTINEFLPALCEVKTYCTDHFEDINATFAGVYGMQQLYKRRFKKPFSCKDENGKKLLGKIINPRAYNHTFNFKKESYLLKELPCKAILKNKPKESTHLTSPDNRGSIDVRRKALIKYQIEKLVGAGMEAFAAKYRF